MATQQQIELARLKAQKRLDSVRSQAERNRLGQFATPPALATEILTFAKSLLLSPRKVRFLDPAFGTGSFYSALLHVFPKSRISEAAGYEIDPICGEEARRLWGHTGLRLEIADFTRVAAPQAGTKANLVICNPPYVRHHHLTADEKTRLQRLTLASVGVKLSGLAGLYCYFLCLSDGWMEENAVAGWLIPSEFMDVNYGAGLKKYLLDRVTLLRIHRFEPTSVQFADALVSSAIVWFRKAPPPADLGVEFSYGGTLCCPKVAKLIPSDVLRGSIKWTNLIWAPDRAEGPGAHLRLSDLFEIKRGLATGANDFFMVSPDQISACRIPTDFLKPILPSPRFLTTDEIHADSDGNPILTRRLFLVDCPLRAEEVRRRFPSLWEYFERGVRRGVSQRYLCLHRSPWYAQEVRPPAPFLCTYMGRSNAGRGRAFRFILNQSRATAPNVYLMLYPRPPLATLLRDNPHLRQGIWHALNQIPPDTLVASGRVYGGGLHKMEPRELGNASAETLLRLLPASFGQRARQMMLFEGSMGHGNVRT